MKNLGKSTKAYTLLLLLVNIVILINPFSIHTVIYTVANIALIAYIIFRDLNFKELEIKQYVTLLLIAYLIVLVANKVFILGFVSFISVINLFTSLPLIVLSMMSIYIIRDGYRTTSTDLRDYEMDQDGNRANRTTAHTYSSQGSGKGETNWLLRSILQEETKDE